MLKRRIIRAITLVALGLGFGCQHPAPVDGQAQNAHPEPALRLHCQGSEALAAAGATNALATVWALPETAALRKVALDKLAARFAAEFPSGTERAALLRPLLDDWMRAESILEISSAGAAQDWTLAVRLEEARARGWREAWKQLTAPAGTGPRANFQIESAPGGWLVLRRSAAGNRSNPASALWNQRSKLGTTRQATNWLEIRADLAQIAPGLAKECGSGRLDLAVQTRGSGVRADGKLRFAQSGRWSFEPWRVPMNTIRDPLISFTAAQGFGPWLARQAWFQKLGLAATPNQIFLWGQSDTPFQVQFAVPVENATNAIARIASNALPAWNAKLSDSPVGTIRYAAEADQIAWNTPRQTKDDAYIGWPFFVPTLRRAPEPAAEFLNGGLLLLAKPNRRPPPAELLAQVTSRTNLLYYDWEITQARLEQLRQLSEVSSIVINTPSFNTNTVAGAWVEAIQNRLGNSITELTASAPDEVMIVRRSHIGLNGLELLALANWIQGTNFPRPHFELGFQTGPAPRVRAPGGPNTPAPRKP